MNDLEERIRRTLRSQLSGLDLHDPTRLDGVRATRRRRSRRRWQAAAGGVALVCAATAATWGLAPHGQAPTTVTSRTAAEEIDALLQGAPVPADFDASPLLRLADRPRVEEVEGLATAVTCAWVSRWADSPDQGERDLARESLAANQDWVMLQAIAPDSGYPSKVYAVAAAILRDDLPTGWASTLGCDTFPGDTNLLSATGPSTAAFTWSPTSGLRRASAPRG